MRPSLKAASLTTAVALTALGAPLAACSSGGGKQVAPEVSVSSASAQVCSDLSNLRADTAKLQALSPTSATKDDLTHAVNAIRADEEKLRANAQTLHTAKAGAVEKAADELRNAYRSLPGNTTLPQARQDLQPQISNLATAVANARSALDCG